MAMPAIAILLSIMGNAQADFIVPVSPSWAGEPNTTSQSWSAMSPDLATVPGPTTPASADGGTNSKGTAVWYDASAPIGASINDDAFACCNPTGGGPDVYSFDGILTPTAVVPGYNIAGNSLNVFVEVQSFGGGIDTTSANALIATYQDPGGNSHTIAVSSSAHSTAYSGSEDVGFGLADQVDHVWEFTLPNDTGSLKLSLGWGVTSAAIQGLAVFTQSFTPNAAQTPEPGSLFLAGLGALGIVACNIATEVGRKHGVPCSVRHAAKRGPVAACEPDEHGGSHHAAGLVRTGPVRPAGWL